MFCANDIFSSVEERVTISNDIVIFIGKINKIFFKDYIEKYDSDFYESLSSRVDLEAYSEKISNLSTTFVIVYKNHIAGLIASYFYDKASLNGFITLVHIKSEYRGLKLSSHLVKTIQHYTKKIKFNTLSLVVYKNNISAYILYSKCGFNVINEEAGKCTMNWNWRTIEQLQ